MKKQDETPKFENEFATELDLINVNGEEQILLGNISFQLSNLAKSFYITGNEKISNQLHSYAKLIRDSATRIDKAVGNSIHKSYIRSQESTANMINAALAGISLAKMEIKK